MLKLIYAKMDMVGYGCVDFFGLFNRGSSRLD